MITWPKATLLLAGTCAAAVCGLAGCNKAPAKIDEPPPNQASTAATTTQPGAAKALQAPPIPDASRTDPEAIAMRRKYVEWTVAQERAANDAAQKQAQQFYGSAPKGNYGRMADGVASLPTDKK